MFSGTFTICLLLSSLPCIFCQADYAHSYTADKMPLEDKALFLADALVQHPDFFRKLLKIASAAQPLLPAEEDPKQSFLLDIFMEKLPDILKSYHTVTILKIIADELRRVDVNDTRARAHRKNLEENSTEFRNMMADDLMARFDTVRALRRFFTSDTVMESYPLDRQGVNRTCYFDLFTFMDALHGVQYGQRQDLNFSIVPWAWKMLDSYGKVPSGMLKRDLDWEGSPEECRKVHAHLDAGVILANITLRSPVNFDGKYCHVLLNVSSTLASVMDTDQGDLLRLGVCVPNSCSGSDIKTFLTLGVLEKFHLDPKSATCYNNNEHIPTKTAVPLSTPVSSTAAPDHIFTSCVSGNNGLNEDRWEHCFFATFDLDKNGGISKDEWKTVYAKLGLQKSNSVDRFFLMLDTDTNLKIDSTDLKYFFTFFDDNGDGLISFTEYTYNWSSLFLLD